MIENPTAKRQIRFDMLTRGLSALISHYGLPMVLDALAVVMKTPDGKLLAAAAEFAKLADENENRPDVSARPVSAN